MLSPPGAAAEPIERLMELIDAEVVELIDAGLAIVADAPRGPTGLAAALASVLIQILSLVRARGLLRDVLMILTGCSGAVLAVVAAAYHLDPGNLWELLVGLAAPPMLALTIGLWLMGMVASRGPTREYAPARGYAPARW